MLRPSIRSSSDGLKFYCLNHKDGISLPMAAYCVSAGFPSPAEDYIESVVDLGKFLVENPSSTFFVRVKGRSMQDAMIFDGDVLIIDKSKRAVDGSIAVCFLDGEFTVKRIKTFGKKIELHPENKNYPVIPVTAESDFRVWGVVSYIIHKAR